jgi:hypothetical protein
MATAIRFTTRISRARFSVSGMNTADMLWIGERFLGKMQDRIGAGRNVYDNDAPPLTEKYRRRKTRQGGFPIRNLYLTGRTFRGMKVLRVDQNQGIIGFADPVAEFRMAMNMRRERQWGISPTDKAFLIELVKTRFVSKTVQAGTETQVA